MPNFGNRPRRPHSAPTMALAHDLGAERPGNHSAKQAKHLHLDGLKSKKLYIFSGDNVRAFFLKGAVHNRYC